MTGNSAKPVERGSPARRYRSIWPSITSASWNAISADVPKMIEALKSRVDILSQSKKLPKGLDAATLSTAKDNLAAATSAWTDATAAQAAGKWSEAMAKANDSKAKATAAMSALGMQTGGAAPAAN